MFLLPREVGDCPRDLAHPADRAHGEVDSCRRPCRSARGRRRPAGRTCSSWRAESSALLVTPSPAYRACWRSARGLHARVNVGSEGSSGALSVIWRTGTAGDLELHVDSVQQRPGDAPQIARDFLLGAAAGLCRAAVIAAGARVHRRDEHRPRGVFRLRADADDADKAVLQRLAQRLQRAAVVLRQLVEKEHAVVREADFAGARLVCRRRPAPPR